MAPDILAELKQALANDIRFTKTAGAWLQGGTCPQCGKKEVFARAENPIVLKCSRANRCGWEQTTRDRYPEIFEVWSKRTPATEENPTATADAYLQHGRHLDLRGLRGAYTQEWYRDTKSGLSTATVRFTMPGGCWWERLIDQPGRFSKKARFAFGGSYTGEAWKRPDVTIEQFAAADEIWFPEGIFNALALEQVGLRAASTMSSSNYPETFLRDVLAATVRSDRPGHRPTLVFAFDNGKAGENGAAKFVKRAREEGWTATAALPREQGTEGMDLDWNDLLIFDRLGKEKIAEYRFNGRLLLAASAVEKARLLYTRHRFRSFPLNFRTETYWASIDAEDVEQQVLEAAQAARGKELVELDADKKEAIRVAAEEKALGIEKIANCAFRVLYRQRDEASDDTCYFLNIDFPSDRPSVKGGFPAGAMTAAAEFKKRLFAIGTGAIWTGSQGQLDRIMQLQTPRIADVHPLEFTGYSRDHGAYVFGDIAVKDGRVYRPNDDDFFEIGKVSIKLGTSERLLEIEYDPEKLDTSWIGDLQVAFGPKGLIVLAFFFGSLFAEQIRRLHKSFPFLEMFGQPGTGKTTLVEFLWKLFGRENYEGFDPAKATPAAMARNLGKVGNLPVVLIEGDRRDEASHARKFEWEELKTAYNGRSVRSRGVKNKGMETFEPPFRGAIVIEQNDPVNASRAILERIISMGFDMAGWSAETKLAAQRLEQWPIEKVSGFIVHAARREAELLARFGESFQLHEKALLAMPEIRTNRLAKTHGQLLALLDVLRVMLPIGEQQINAARMLVTDLAKERQVAVNAEHPVVTRFWELFDYLEENETTATELRLNHSRDGELIAIRLNEFMQRCADRRLEVPKHADLVRELKSSKSRRYLEQRPVNSVTDTGTKHCWIFERPKGSAR